MPFKSVQAAFLISLGVHAAAGAALVYPIAEAGALRRTEPILISSVSYSEPKLPKAKPVIKPAVRRPARKPRVRTKTETVRAAKTQGVAAKPAVSAAVAPPPPRKSSELLTDPQKGVVFMNYFGAVKEKIDHAVRKRYDPDHSNAKGHVSLLFVLSSDGMLRKATVLERESSADAALKKLSLECLQEAAPFKGFPKDLESSQISFNVTIFFDEL